MRYVYLTIAVIALGAGPAVLQQAAAESGDTIYLFYLHGRIVEDAGPTPTHPEYGLYDYPAVIAALGARGAEIVSEVRASGTDADDYAGKVAAEIEALLAGGVPPGNVVVAGFSKGGGIAIRVSYLLERPDVRFALLAACGGWISDYPELRLTGRIYSIFEASDEIAGSCAELANRGSGVVTFRELEIDTGQRHGAFYLPRPAWTEPLLDWVHGGAR